MTPLHPEIRKQIIELARTYKKRGIRLFLFGSVAKTWPLTRKGADLDIGIESLSQSDEAEKTKKELLIQLERLPTIRPLDGVDFDNISSSFRTIAMQTIIELADES